MISPQSGFPDPYPRSATPTRRTALRRRWWSAALLFGVTFALGYRWLLDVWPAANARQWAAISIALLFYELWLFRRTLPHNRRRNDAPLLPTLGLGTTLTLLRGLCIGLLAGFLFMPRPAGGLLAWTPALLYTAVGLLDILDGYAARKTDHVTLLGARLDGEFDALGLLVAVGLAVWYNQLPAWYLLVGLSKYMFSLGSWWRVRCGRPVFDLPPSNNRRLTAGMQMGFISVVLWPLFAPPATMLAGVLFATPFLLGFLRDWLAVSGRLDPDSARYRTIRHTFLRVTTRWLPVPLRLLVIGAALLLLAPVAGDSLPWSARFAWPGSPFPEVTAIALGLLGIVAVLLLLLGILGRLAALGLLAATCATILSGGLQPLNTLLLLGAISILLLGSGSFSLWQPEEWALRRRAGSAQPSETF